MKIKILSALAAGLFAASVASAATDVKATPTVSGSSETATFYVGSGASKTAIGSLEVLSLGKIDGKYSYQVTFNDIADKYDFTGGMQIGDLKINGSFFNGTSFTDSFTKVFTSSHSASDVLGHSIETKVNTLGGSRIQQVASVPEPETFAMLLAGLGVMGAVAARRRKKV